MRAGWDESRAGLGIGVDEAACVDLVARYLEPGRHYHDLAHVAACLAELEPLRALANRLPEVTTALLFHDVIYVAMRPDNEAKSAELAAQVLGRAGADPAAVQRIRVAIEATRTHDAPDDDDVALVLDVDMSILAAPAETFDAYEDGVRAEHAVIDDATFAGGRSAFVRGLLARPRVFHVPELHTRWDARARANLERSLRRWTSRDAASIP